MFNICICSCVASIKIFSESFSFIFFLRCIKFLIPMFMEVSSSLLPPSSSTNISHLFVSVSTWDPGHTLRICQSVRQLWEGNNTKMAEELHIKLRQTYLTVSLKITGQLRSLQGRARFIWATHAKFTPTRVVSLKRYCRNKLFLTILDWRGYTLGDHLDHILVLLLPLIRFLT